MSQPLVDIKIIKYLQHLSHFGRPTKHFREVQKAFWAPRASRAPQGHPNGIQREPLGAPRVPKWSKRSQTGSQRVPNGAPKKPHGPQRRPNGPQMQPHAPQSCTKGRHRHFKDKKKWFLSQLVSWVVSECTPTRNHD